MEKEISHPLKGVGSGGI